MSRMTDWPADWPCEGERTLVLCTDSKSKIQTFNGFDPVLPIMPGTPERRNHDFVSLGTASVFAALDMATGKVIDSLQLGRRERHVVISGSGHR
jgi:hypothetical protein